MKKLFILLTILTGFIFFNTAHGQTDYGTIIIGTWKFDLGSGMMATIEYKKDGKFEQKIDEMIIGGTFTVRGNKLTTVTMGQKTVFTLISFSDNTLIIKRDKDGRSIEYMKQ